MMEKGLDGSSNSFKVGSILSVDFFFVCCKIFLLRLSKHKRLLLLLQKMFKGERNSYDSNVLIFCRLF